MAYVICCWASYKELPFNIRVSFVRISKLPYGAVSLRCMWLVCLPETDTGGQVAAVVSAALSCGLKAAGVTAAAIGEGVGRVRVALNFND